MSNNTEKELLLRLHDKVDVITDKINDIEIVQIRHEENLKEHIRRTDLAEERLEFIENEVKPMLEGASFLKTVAKMVAYIGSAIYGVLQIFR